ncbi:MAG TPA: prolyl oligopeptidase family serine peptidase [Candidatus Baltobacteraceae bacterium]|nr:prolyl oligopeptidase family serine peptidase [Candidatus Baltobacteraceae bacterium]
MKHPVHFAASLALLAALLVSPAITPAAAQTSDAPQTTVAQPPQGVTPGIDPFLWLEKVHGARAMAWVKAENEKTLGVLEKDPRYAGFYKDALAVVTAKDRIAFPSTIHGEIYNFWQDETHVRGIWRKTTVASYATASPQWTTVLDLDAVAKAEKANWVWEGANCALPAETRCLISLSSGGEDAQTLREFDLTTHQFVRDGFALPRGKQNVVWETPNTLLVAREWTKGELTASGYPYVVARLRRGQPLSSAVEIFRGTKHDVSVSPYTLDDPNGSRAVFIQRGIDFFNNKTYILTPKGLKQLGIPSKVSPTGLLDGRLLLQLNQDWNVAGRRFRQGSVAYVDLAAAMAHPENLYPHLVYSPGPLDSVQSVTYTRHAVLLDVYHNVRGRIYALTPTRNGWSQRRLALPDNASLDIVDTNLHNDRAYFDARGFLTPTTLYSADVTSGAIATVKALPAQFDASNEAVDQHEATSKDGTRIPYFIVHSKNIKLDGSNPTVLYAYGGFQISETPYYSGVLGKLWLERGGVFVLANIRGGGEFGPAWHEAGLKTHRQRVYDDFYAVAQDLVTRKITTPRRLGIQGGSNGGLLMGVEFTQHPEMWNAVDIQVPLLDMLRFEKIEAGASWVGEYGSVSVPVERAFLAKISPYNNLRAGTAYPQPLIWTTTKDDRVGPEHARKFAAMLGAMNVPYYFYEVTEGGHGAGANLDERAHTSALEWTYFTMKLMP